jgi:hypothetical protein
MLNKVEVVISDLTGKVYLARFGKDPTIALEKKEVTESELLRLVTAWMLHDAPTGATLDYQDGNGQRYELTGRPIAPALSLEGERGCAYPE